MNMWREQAAKALKFGASRNVITRMASNQWAAPQPRLYISNGPGKLGIDANNGIEANDIGGYITAQCQYVKSQ